REVARADGPVTVEVRCERRPQDADRLQDVLGSDAPEASRTAPASRPISTSSPSRYHVPSLEPSMSASASGMTLDAQPHVQPPWAFPGAACALIYCAVPAYPWRWRRSTASWSRAGLGVVSPRPCTMRFDMVNTAVTKTRKYKARSSCPAANKAATS